VPIAEAQPGDAIFWSKDPDRVTANAHVAIYLGDNQVIEALDHQHRVGIHWLRGDSPGRYRMPYAVRFVR
jgi:cell wall-associated NlpC family hydrolase